MATNNDGIFILSVDRVNPLKVEYFDFGDDFPENDYSKEDFCYDEDDDEYEDDEWIINVDCEDEHYNYAYTIIVNHYGKIKEFTIGMLTNNFNDFMDNLRGAINSVMIDTDTNDIYDMFKESNYIYK